MKKIIILVSATLLLFVAGCSNPIAKPNPVTLVSNTVLTEPVNPADTIQFTASREATVTAMKGTPGTEMPLEVISIGQHMYKIEEGEISYGDTVTVTAKAEDSPDYVLTFHTISPVNQVAIIAETEGPIGNGSLIRLKFDEPVLRKQTAEKALVVINAKTKDPIPGAWRWSSSQDVQFRPEKPWVAGSEINVKGNIYGKQLGKKSLYGQENFNQTLQVVPDDWQVIVNDRTKHTVVKKNGKVVLNAPVSLGKSGYGGALLTPEGKYVVGSKHDFILMSSSPGTPEGYTNTPVSKATQISYSGIFFHQAEWNIPLHGNTNDSHGCINMDPADAAWLLKNVPTGTIVTVKNTGGPQLPITDGLGYWNGSLEEFKKSA